jgi:hypothetical protein
MKRQNNSLAPEKCDFVSLGRVLYSLILVTTIILLFAVQCGFVNDDSCSIHI